MQQSQYKQKYQQLELIQSNSMDDFKLFLVKQIDTSAYRTAKKTSLFECSNANQDKILNEVQILRELSNPHVIKYYNVFLEEEDLIVILEFCEEGDLEYYAKRKKEKKESFSEKLILSWVLQILMGLEYIHSKNIIHRMICLRNIYMNHQGDLKLGSFGGAKMLENTLDKAMTVIGSPCDLSPEVVQGKSYDNKIDIWALGCIIYQLATHQHPFKIRNLTELYDKIVKSPPEDLPHKYSKYLNPIYKKMMKKNPANRPSAAELLQQEVFIKLMKQYTKKKKIDSLDLREVVPKRLLAHKNKKTSLPLLSSSRISAPPGKVRSLELMNKTSQIPVRNRSKQKSKSKQKPMTSSLNYQQSKLPSISASIKSGQNSNPNDSPKKFIPNIPKPDKKSTKTPKKSSQQTKQTQKNSLKIKQAQKNEDIVNQQSNSQTKTTAQKENRLTLPDLMEGQYISLLCQIKLELLEKKYLPNMSKIFEQTVQFDQYQ